MQANKNSKLGSVNAKNAHTAFKLHQKDINDRYTVMEKKVLKVNEPLLTEKTKLLNETLEQSGSKTRSVGHETGMNIGVGGDSNEKDPQCYSDPPLSIQLKVQLSPNNS